MGVLESGEKTDMENRKTVEVVVRILLFGFINMKPAMG